MLTYPRTGSNYLSAALNHTGKFKPTFQEWFNPEVQARERPDAHLTTTWWPWLNLKEETVYHTKVEPLLENLPRYLKVHNFDYDLYFKIEHREEIIKRLPGIKFIRLRRRSRIECTVSYYLAMQTQIFECLEPDKHAAISVPVDKEKLNTYFQWIYWWDKYWDDFVDGIDHLEVYYEDMVADIEVLRQIYTYVGLKPALLEKALSIIGEKKLKHPQTQELTEMLERELCRL
jgi:LPS sulfotransferase NodH